MARTLNQILNDNWTGLGDNKGGLTTLLTRIYNFTRNRLMGDPGLAIASDFDVQNTLAYTYMLGGQTYSDAASGTCDTGTAATFAAGTWGVFKVSVDASGGLTATWATNSSLGYGTEALAIAALPDTPSDELSIGYVTVQAHASNSFTAGSDALQGGSGGNVSQDTNYYDADDPNVAPNPDAAT